LLPSCASDLAACYFAGVLLKLLLLLLLLLLLVHLDGQEKQVLSDMLLLLRKMLLLQLLFLQIGIVTIRRETNLRLVGRIPGIRSRLLGILLRFVVLLFRWVLERHIPMILWQLRLLLLLLWLAKVLKILILIIGEPLRGYLRVLLHGHLKILIRLYVLLF